MTPTQRAYFELNIAVLLFGFTAILGDLITLSALVLVWWRMGITTLSIPFLKNLRVHLSGLPKQLIGRYMGIGVIVALHWMTFFGAVKLSNASITLICMATASAFTALIEPVVHRHRINWKELMLGLLMVPGIALIVNHTEWAMMSGVWVGLTSAFLAALFSTLNKTVVDKADPMVITFLELGSGWLFLTLLMPFVWWQMPRAQLWPQHWDWLWLLILALGCTTLAYVLTLRSLRHISAFASNLMINLEPVYGIFLAWLLLDDGQELTGQFYWGCALILGAVFFHAWQNLKK